MTALLRIFRNPWLALLLLAGVSPLAAAEFKEDFSEVPEGALLSTRPGWTKQGDADDTWTVTNHSGRDGGCIEAAKTGKYHLNLTEVGFALDGSKTPPFSVKAKIFLNPNNDAWTDVRIDLLKSGGVSGLGLRFNGGKTQSGNDNSIGLSTGGKSWGAIEYAVHDGPWEPNIWYQVDIHDLEFTSEGAQGKVTIYPVDDPKTKLVDGEPIQSYGKGNPGTFDLLSISSIGADRPFLLDDIVITEGGASSETAAK